ncbi:MAG: VCBS repeat-containing protein [Myxococcota bacterium]
MRGAWLMCGLVVACGSDDTERHDVTSGDTVALDSAQPVDTSPPPDVAPSACTIDGVAHASGAVDPDNACQACDPTRAADAWSPRLDGVVCDAGKGCGSACVAKCFIDGVLREAGAVDPQHACFVCTPGRSVLGWSALEDGASCPGGLCLGQQCVTAPSLASVTPTCAPNDGSGVLQVGVDHLWPAGATFSVAGHAATATPISVPTLYAVSVPALPGVTGLVDVTAQNVAGDAGVLEDAVDLFAGFGLSFSFVATTDIIDPFAIGDVDGDHHDDVVYLVTNAIHVERGLAHDGTAAHHDVIDDRSYFPLGVGDFDGDGRSDVVSGSGGGVFVFAGQAGAAPVFSKQSDLGLDIRILAVGHFDAGSALDVAIVGPFSSKVQLLLGDGAGGFSLGPVIETGHAITTMEAGQVDGDGRDDLVVGQYEAQQVVVLIAEGSGFAAPSSLPADGIQTIAIADFDADGHGDLLLTGGAELSTRLFLGQGGGAFATPVQLTGGALSGAAAGDFNGDGHLDVVASGGPGMRLIAGRGDGTFWCTYEVALDPSPYVWRTGDFDGDGHVDLAATTPIEQKLIHAMGNPLPTVAPR